MSSEYVEASQGRQSASASLPFCGAYFPLPHPVHVLDPAREKVPMSHCLQVSDESAPIAPELVPGSHSEHGVERPGSTEYVPGPQLSHSEEPAISLYFPWTQDSQVPPSSPEKPALQRHVIRSCRLTESAGHVLHSVDANAAVDVPISHATHPADPPTSLYFPAGQLSQEPPLGPV